MAVFKSLTFDGINSLNYGIYVTGEAVYNAPERAVEMVTIPGRNGALAIDQGYFDNIEVSYPCGCFAETQADFAEKVSAFRNAIGSRYSYKRLTDEYNADEYRLGLYKSGLEVDAVRYGTAGQFTITFDCKPQRFLLDGDAELSPTDYSDVHTVSGDIVQITNDGSLGIKSLTADIEPIQSLNGYDKPWGKGAGKNTFPAGAEATITTNGVTFTSNGNGVYTLSGTATATAVARFYLSQSFVIQPSNTHKVAFMNSTSSVSVSFVFFNGTTQVDSWGLSPVNRVATSYAAMANKECNSIGFQVVEGETVNMTVSPMMTLQSADVTTFEPYSNECPISGHTECVTSVVGKNLIDFSNCEVKSVDAINNAYGPLWAELDGTYKENTQYTFSCDVQTADTTKAWGITAVYTDGTQSYYWIHQSATNVHSVTTAANKTINKIRFAYNSVHQLGFSNAQLELGSTATSYEPYDGTTYTTDLGRTVYGGTLDVVSGVLTVDRAMVTLNGSETWAHSNGTVTACMRVQTRTSVGFKPNTLNASLVGDISSAFVEVTPTQTWVGTIGFSVSTDANPYLHFCQTGQKNMSVEAWKTYLASNPIQVVGLLATPQTYQLTPQEVQLLLGTNNVWSDGEITVEYGVQPYYNPTPFASKPLIKVTGTGTLGIGEYILTITGTASQTLYIDCETMEIYTFEGTVPTGASSLVSINKNDFPVLEPGTNYISVGSGITAVTITPRWWRI